MTIELTYNGKKQKIENVSIGGQITVEYVKSDGEKMVYHLILTKKETMLLNK